MQTDEEKVDIVDTDNHVLYQTTRSEAHRKGLLHQTMIAEVIDTNGKWLMVKQTASRQDPGQYVSPVGGHVRAGEHTDDALKIIILSCMKYIPIKKYG